MTTAGKPAPPGDPDNPAVVAQAHHTFVIRPDGGHGHVNHRGHPAPLGAHPPAAGHRCTKQANLFTHNDIVIAAPAAKIWEHLIHVTAWPDWYSNASDVIVNASSGLLGAGGTFDWITFGAPIHWHRPRVRAPGPHRLVRPDRPVAGLPHLAARAARGGNHLRGHGGDRRRRQPEGDSWLQSRATCTAGMTCGTSA